MQEDFQSAFAAIVCDRDTRRLFHHAPSEALAAFALSAKEKRVLCTIPKVQWDRYANSLVQEKWRELATIVPCSHRLSPGLAQIYKRWIERSPSGNKDSILAPGQRQALRALPHMHAALSRQCESQYAPDLFAFEVLSSCSKADNIPRFLRTRCEIHTIALQIQDNELSVEAPSTPTQYRFCAKGFQWKRPV